MAFFLVALIGVLWLLHAVVYAVTARVFMFALPYWPLFCLLLSGLFLLVNVGVRKLDSMFTTGFYVVMVTWLGVLFLLFSATVVYELAHILTREDKPVILAGLFILVGVSSFYALYNASKMEVKEYTLPIKGLSESVKIVHLSDVHVGTIHQEGFLKRVVDLTNAQNPDLVLMTGDLFDGSAPIQPEMLRYLDSLNAPAYFSNGNHEEYEGLAAVKDTLSTLEMELLENKVATWGELNIIGVNDRQSLKNGENLNTVLESLSYDATRPTILMYHTPVDWEVARAKGVDLMLSGHTHQGQIWPFTLLVRLSFKYVSGLFSEEGKYLHVTPGTGTWGPPMRLGSRNQVTVINLVPQK